MQGWATIHDRDLVLDGEFRLSLTEAMSGEVVFQLEKGDKSLAKVEMVSKVADASFKGSPHETEKPYAKSDPNGRSWLITALSRRIILLCPVKAYPSLTSGTGR